MKEVKSKRQLGGKKCLSGSLWLWVFLEVAVLFQRALLGTMVRTSGTVAAVHRGIKKLT